MDFEKFKCATPNCNQPAFLDGLCQDCFNELNRGGREKIPQHNKQHKHEEIFHSKPKSENIDRTNII